MSEAIYNIVGVNQTAVALETSAGSGIFVPQPRMRADRIALRSDGQLSSATIAVRLDDSFDALDAVELCGPDRRIIVHTCEEDPDQRQMLFEGYPARQQAVRDGGPQSPRDDYTIEAVSVYSTLAEDERAWIWGRRMRNGAIADGVVGDPDRYVGRSVHVPALPCVFNANGVPNRASTPLEVVDASGRPRRIAIFTYDGDPDATSWSLLDALRYLLWFRQLPEGPVSVSETLDLTEPGVGVEAGSPASITWPVVVQRLLVPAEGLDCEATNLFKAVAQIVTAAGIHATCVTDNVNGVPQSRLSIWAPEDAPARSLHLAWGGRHGGGSPRYDADKLTVDDVLRDNELRRLELTWDYRELVNAPLVIGGVKRWEMTVPLVPGWLPEANLDNVPVGEREQAKALALTPDMVDFLGDDAELVEWFRRYHRWGDEFDAYRNVGRLWVLNEDGGFDATQHNRNAPYDDYRAFDFSQVAGDVTRRGAWTRRPRPMGNPISVRADGRPLAVLVEMSFDAGATWREVYGQVSVLGDRAGVWLGINNLTSLTPADTYPEDGNLWFALIDQVFRLRATGTFEGDERLYGQSLSGWARTPTVRRRSRVVYAPQRYRFQSRRGTTNVLASMYSSETGVEIDDSPTAAALADRITKAEARGEVCAEATIPWLARDVVIGDCIDGLHGRDVSARGLLRGAHLAGGEWCVIGKVYELGGDRLETRLELAAVDPFGQTR